MDSTTDSYEAELETLMGPLYVAAIDAYMGGLFYSKVDGDRAYGPTMGDGKNPKIGGGSEDVKVRITRPDASTGLGGGEGQTEGVHNAPADAFDFTDDFNRVRSEMNDLVKPWKSLPDPNQIATKIQDYRDGVLGNLIWDGSSRADLQTVADGKGDLPSSDQSGRMKEFLSRLDGAIKGPGSNEPNGKSGLSGSAADAFIDKYNVKMPGVIDNLNTAGQLHRLTLMVEKKIFEDSRKKVVEAIKNATATFEMIGNKIGGGEFKLTLQFVKAALDLVVSFPSTMENLGFEAAYGVIESADRSKAVHSYQQVKEEFKQALHAISWDIHIAERSVNNYLSKNLSILSQEKDRDYSNAKFQLKYGNSPSQDGKQAKSDKGRDGSPIRDTDGGTLSVSEASVDDISRAMWDIHDLVNNAGTKLGGISMSDVVRRDSSIGFGETGPSGSYDQYGQVLYELLRDLQWQIEQGIVNLKLAYNDLQHQDEDSQSKLNFVATQIQQGNSGVDPWDQQKQTDINSYNYFKNDPGAQDPAPDQQLIEDIYQLLNGHGG